MFGGIVMKARIHYRLAIFAFASCLIGCVVVPPHDGLARVHVGDVMKRVKCDLAEVVFEKAQERTPDGKYPFLFLKEWAAKIHLTIAVDDTVGVNPGATVTHPLDKTVATTLIPATVETFSLGIGAGLSTEAIRTEDIEFLVSFSDMIKEFQKPTSRELYHGCVFDNGLFLESDLGLGSVVNSALEPVGSGVLYQGHNVGPGAPPPPIPDKQMNDLKQQLKELKEASQNLPRSSPDQSIADLANSLKNKSQLNALITKFGISNEAISKSENQFKIQGQAPPSNVGTVKDILANTIEATAEETRTQSIVNDVVKPLYAIASSSLDQSCLTQVTATQFEAITWAAKVSLYVIQVDKDTDLDSSNNDLKAVKAAKEHVIDATTQMIGQISSCKKPVAKKGPPEYDPIDVIGETVNFFVTATGSVTPSWKLVKVTAPLAPTFLSGSRKDTNTLILAMGRPAPATGGGITGSNAMNNQILSAILSQAVTVQRALP
jgi:hypothetical protein